MQKQQLLTLLSVLGDQNEVKSQFHVEGSYSYDCDCYITGIGMEFTANGLKATIKVVNIDDEVKNDKHITKATLTNALAQINDDSVVNVSLERTYSSTIGELSGLEVKFEENSLYAVLCAKEIVEADQEIAA